MDNQTIYALTVEQMSRQLTSLGQWLEKSVAFAKAREIEPDQFLQQRLIVDQFSLIKQIQTACDAAKFAVARLTGKEAPKHPDTEQTLAEAHTRLKNVIEFLNSFKADDFAGASERRVTQGRKEGYYIRGEDYLLRVALPNFNFHVVTAYSILRANGVTLGKSDFLGGGIPWVAL